MDFPWNPDELFDFHLFVVLLLKSLLLEYWISFTYYIVTTLQQLFLIYINILECSKRLSKVFTSLWN